MIDHILLDVIGALRGAFESALLEQQAVEERFQVDVFLGDLSFETSYSLPGESSPARVRADLSLDWPTWSQSAYRSWSIGEPPAESPELIVELAFRLQNLVEPPAHDKVMAVLDEKSPELGSEQLERGAPTVEQTFAAREEESVAALEVSYQGSLRLDDSLLEDPSKLGPEVDALARWVASALVRLADLELPTRPGEEDVHQS
ncbi:MAG: hypothetical protein ACRDZ5_09165 [Acidimicrobiales bacterium]